MREMFPTGETMDLGNLPQYWQEVDQAFGRLEALPSLRGQHLLSARAFDEAKPAGPRTYIEVERFLGVAWDNHYALLALLEKHGATVWAPWSLLRPIFETSFLAAWILDPDDSQDRRSRGLRCEVRDALEQRRHLASFASVPEMQDLIKKQEEHDNAGAMRTYQEEAEALGLDWERLKKQTVNIVDEIPKLSVVKDGDLAPFVIATWRSLSGYEHGLTWASMRGSDTERVGEVPGGVSMQLTINDGEFVNAGKATYLLLLTACRLLERRHTSIR